MKKILYLTSWDFSDEPSSGITKKIKSQIKVFVKKGYKLDYTYISNGSAYICEDEVHKNLGKVGMARKLIAYYLFYKNMKDNSYQYVYSRYGLSDKYYYKLLKYFHDSGSKIVVEIPTYPYDQEKLKGIEWNVLYTYDKIYRKKMKGVVDYIFTFSKDNEIFGIPTIQSINGVDFDNIEVRKVKKTKEQIDLIAVAGLAKWHGYDRLLRGMGEYYRNGGKRIVNFHIVGDGPPLFEYKKIIEEYHIQKYVFLYGIRKGEELDEIYNKSDIGVENLGFHRTGVYYASTLKSKEYAAKGLPFISSCQLDIFDGADFILKFPSDESNINIDKIITFYDILYQSEDMERKSIEIREKAKKLCNIDITMEPVIDFFERNI